jgi:hypothetical protein
MTKCRADESGLPQRSSLQLKIHFMDFYSPDVRIRSIILSLMDRFVKSSVLTLVYTCIICIEYMWVHTRMFFCLDISCIHLDIGDFTGVDFRLSLRPSVCLSVRQLVSPSTKMRITGCSDYVTSTTNILFFMNFF